MSEPTSPPSADDDSPDDFPDIRPPRRGWLSGTIALVKYLNPFDRDFVTQLSGAMAFLFGGSICATMGRHLAVLERQGHVHWPLLARPAVAFSTAPLWVQFPAEVVLLLLLWGGTESRSPRVRALTIGVTALGGILAILSLCTLAAEFRYYNPWSGPWTLRGALR
jgi:hypothetical protein